MATHVGSTTSSLGRVQTDDEDLRSVYMHGVGTGLIGALVVAGWFFYLDFSRGQLLFTPTVLGTVLFQGADRVGALDSVTPSILMTLLFTLVHGGVFVGVGAAAARLLDAVEHHLSVVLCVALLFVVLGLGFLAFAMTFAALPLEILSWPDVLFGNFIAAAAMAAHLWRRRPRHGAEPH